MVRLVGEGVEPNIYPLREALRIVEELGVDLVEIQPDANDQKKRLKEQKAKATKVVIKEIRLGPQTDDHDFEIKLNHAKRFLQEGSKVKVEVFFRGRSIVYKEQGEIILLKFAQELEEFGKVEMMPKLEGKRMQMMIAPKSTKK